MAGVVLERGPVARHAVDLNRITLLRQGAVVEGETAPDTDPGRRHDSPKVS